MAKSTFVDNGEITEVYYRFGNFRNDNRSRFVKAPFVRVKIGTEEYFMPAAVGSTERELDTVINATVTDSEYYLGRNDFGFINGNPLYLNESELGDLQDNWRGVHYVGMI